MMTFGPKRTIALRTEGCTRPIFPLRGGTFAHIRQVSAAKAMRAMAAPRELFARPVELSHRERIARIAFAALTWRI